MSGDLHLLIHQTVDDEGGTHLTGHDQPQGVSGVGLTTGETFRMTCVNRGEEKLIYVTINDNGTLTSEVVNSSIDCK